MTKYKDNESYEKDKAAIILTIGNVPIGEGMTIADLLKQSEWVGAKSQMLAEIYCLADDIAQDLDYNNSNDINRELSKAIGEAVLKGYQIKDLIDIDDDQQANSLRFIRPIPVVKDKYGKFTKNYTLRDWFNKLDEELTEAKMAAVDRSSLTMYNIIKAVDTPHG